MRTYTVISQMAAVPRPYVILTFLNSSNQLIENLYGGALAKDKEEQDTSPSPTFILREHKLHDQAGIRFPRCYERLKGEFHCWSA